MVDIKVKMEGDDAFLAALKRFPAEMKKSFEEAGKESATLILETEGVAHYPPETSANKPPEPYYIRGVGMQHEGYNDGSSEDYGAKWTVAAEGYNTRLGNVASYAPYLGGEEQAAGMAAIGWKKLSEVGRQHLPRITKIFNAWLDRTIKKLGLK